MSDARQTTTARWWLGRSALFAALALYFFALRLHSGFDLGTEWVDADVGVRVQQSVRMMQGELPYRDFWAHHMPASYFLNTWLFRTFGVELSSLRLGLAIVGTVIAFMSYVITRRLASRFAAAAACAFTLSWNVIDLNVNYNTWYCVPLALIALWAMIVGIDNKQRWPWFIAGCAAGLVAGFKLNYGIVVILMIGLGAIAASGSAEPRWRGILRDVLLVGAGVSGAVLTAGDTNPATILHFSLPMAAAALLARRSVLHRTHEPATWLPNLLMVIAGLTITLAPWVVYFAMGWEAGAFLHTVLVDFIKYGEDVALSPAPPRLRAIVFAGLVATAALCAARNRLTAAIACGAIALSALVVLNPGSPPGSRSYALVRNWIYVRSALTPIMLLVALAMTWRLPLSDPRRTPLLALSAGASAMLLTYYPYSDINHLQWTWPPIAILACIVLDRAAGAGRVSVLWVVLAVSGVQLFQLATHFIRPETEDGPWKRREFALAAPPRGDVYVPTERAQAITDAVQLIHNTPDGAPILELYGHFLGFLADRPNPTRYDYFWPGWLSDKEQNAVADVVRRTPPALVVGHRQSPEDEPLERFAAAFPIFGGYLAEAYRPVQRIGPYQFYAPRPAATRDSAIAASSGSNHSNGVLTSPNSTSGLASP